MKLNKIMMAAVITLGTSSLANAGDGTVTFKGSITTAPCSISSDTVNQVVELGAIGDAVLADGGQSTPRVFDIKLEQCNIDLLTDKTVTATFTGAPGPTSPTNKGLGLIGLAKGASVMISDVTNDPITLGSPTTVQALANGSNTLRFSAYLKGDNSTLNPIQPGDFTAVADFVLNYL